MPYAPPGDRANAGSQSLSAPLPPGPHSLRSFAPGSVIAPSTRVLPRSRTFVSPAKTCICTHFSRMETKKSRVTRNEQVRQSGFNLLRTSACSSKAPKLGADKKTQGNGVGLIDLVCKIGASSHKPTASAVGRKILKSLKEPFQGFLHGYKRVSLVSRTPLRSPWWTDETRGGTMLHQQHGGS